jgi:hypothetical protein
LRPISHKTQLSAFHDVVLGGCCYLGGFWGKGTVGHHDCCGPPRSPGTGLPGSRVAGVRTKGLAWQRMGTVALGLGGLF